MVVAYTKVVDIKLHSLLHTTTTNCDHFLKSVVVRLL